MHVHILSVATAACRRSWQSDHINSVVLTERCRPIKIANLDPRPVPKLSRIPHASLHRPGRIPYASSVPSRRSLLPASFRPSIRPRSAARVIRPREQRQFSMTRRVPASPCRAEMPAAASSSRRWRLQPLRDSFAIAHHPAQDEQPRRTADAHRLSHDVVGLQQVDHAGGKDDGRTAIRAVARGDRSRQRPATATRPPPWRGKHPASRPRHRDRRYRSGKRARWTPICPVPAPSSTTRSSAPTPARSTIACATAAPTVAGSPTRAS